MASTSQQIGGALGLALLVSLANAGLGGSQAAGIEQAVGASALLALLGALLALRLRVPASGSEGLAATAERG